MQRKSIKLWIWLLVVPWLMLIVVALIQLVIHSISNNTQSTGGALTAIFNILSILVGLAAVLLILGMPVWITLLIKTILDNNRSAAPQQPQYPQNSPAPLPPEPPLNHDS